MSAISENCPSCKKHFLYSSLLRETSRELTLHCGYCENDYNLPNNDGQRKHLKEEYGEPTQVHQLLAINQLSKGDVIAFQMGMYQHHAVVTDVIRQTGKVTVVEFAPDVVSSVKSGVIKRNTKDFKEDIQKKNAWVRLYMPLDCLPVDDVLKKANGFIDNPESQPKYDLFRFNCQHLSTWCKIGKLKSTEAAKARWFYHNVFHSVQIFSFLANPAIAIGALVYTAGDTIVRLGRIFRTEYELMEKEMKTTWEAVGPDALSLAASTVFVGAAVITAAPAVAATAAVLGLGLVLSDGRGRAAPRRRMCSNRYCSACAEGRDHKCSIS